MVTPIFYDETAELLGMSVDTLRHAVSRKVLTRFPGEGPRGRLIKEQVMLFANPRRRLSLAALKPQERKLWQQYANDTTTSTLPASGEEMIRAITRQEVVEQLAPLFQAEEENRAADAKAQMLREQLAAIEDEKEERSRKAFSLLLRTAAQAIA